MDKLIGRNDENNVTPPSISYGKNGTRITFVSSTLSFSAHTLSRGPF